MDRVARPLRAMGAQVECLGAGDRPPLRVGGTSAVLEGCTHVLDVDSAQVRSAILLAGLRASGPTAIAPAGASRDHTLRMLQALGMHVAGAGGRVVLHPTRPEGWESFDLDVPGDVSSAAFAIAFAAARRGSRLVVGGVALNPGRVRYLALLEQAGAALAVVPRGTALGEPFGDVRVRGGTLRGLRLRGVDVVQCLDEVPALLAAWAVAGSPAVVRDAVELRVKESDRIAGLAALLRAFGARVGEREDGVALSACSALRPARVASGGDHRLAMAAAMLAFGAPGASLVEDVGCADTSYPGFARDLLRLARPLAPDSHPAHRSAGDHRPASARKPGPSGERRGRTRPARP